MLGLCEHMVTLVSHSAGNLPWEPSCQASTVATELSAWLKTTSFNYFKDLLLLF